MANTELMLVINDDCVKDLDYITETSCEPKCSKQTEQCIESAGQAVDPSPIDDVIAVTDDGTQSISALEKENEEDSSIEDCSDVGTYTDSSDGSEDDDDDIDEFVDAGEDIDAAGEHDNWMNERRHSGDGEEQPDKLSDVKKLDDDQDRQNPAYVPRKGSFFEHDVRRGEDGDDQDKGESQDSKPAAKKLWIETKKWQHDRFDERSQAPKSRQEIVAAYGFDIRNSHDGEARINSKIHNDKKQRASRRNHETELGDYITVPVEKTVPDQKSVKSHVQNAGQPDVSRHELLHSSSEASTASHSAVRQADQSASGGRLRGWFQGDAHQPCSTELSENSGRRVVRNADEKMKKRHDVGSYASRVIVDGSQSSTRRVEHTVRTNKSSSSQPSRMSSHPARLSRMIITSDRRLISQSSALRYDGKRDGETSTGAVSITVVTESQDARRNFPEHPQSVTSITGPDRRSDKKSTIIVHSTMAPEIIPPMTRVVTYTKSSKPTKSKGGHSAPVSNSVNDETTVVQSRGGWTGGDFTPAACRSLPVHVSSSLMMSSNAGRTKRYSSQRQRNVIESAISDVAGEDADLTSTSVAHSGHIVNVTSVMSLQTRPIAAAAFYSNPPPSLSSGQIPLFASTMQTNPGSRMVGAQSIIHPTYMTRAGPVPILPQSSFIGPPPVIGYGPPLASPTGPNYVPIPFGGVQISEVGSNPLEVRGGTVYFSPEAQKSVAEQRGGTIYFDPGQQAASGSVVRSPARRPKAAIPIVNPQDLKELKQSESTPTVSESVTDVASASSKALSIEISTVVAPPEDDRNTVGVSAPIDSTNTAEE